MAPKETIMRLKVDLQCEKCYKKVKKVLCKFPQIRDQVFDEKNNIVTIKVVCCDPEKIRDKLCCKGCGAIKSIEIVELPKAKPPPEPKPKPKEQSPKLKDPSGPPKPKPPEHKPAPPPAKPRPPPPKPPQPAPKPPELAPPPVVPVPGIPPPARVPIGVCCVPCSEGRPGGPCFEGYGRPPPCYCGCYYGRPVYDSYGGGRPCYYVSRCDQYISEENPNGCTIM